MLQTIRDGKDERAKQTSNIKMNFCEFNVKQWIRPGIFTLPRQRGGGNGRMFPSTDSYPHSW